jgi:hypothetical protein
VQQPYPSLTPAPTSTFQGEIETALVEFHRVRAEAEETLNPDLLWQVCADPYLSQKMERVRANARDGSHWETLASDFAIQWSNSEGYDAVRVQVRKWETKLFYPRGAALPDDETCGGTIYSYRNCAYDTEYRMIQSGGRWYVAEATPLGECLSVCQIGLPTATPTVTPTPGMPTATPAPSVVMVFPVQAVEPTSRPALPADLYFLRGGRLWRWPAAGGDLALVRAPNASVSDEVQEYRFSPGGDSIAYLTRAARLYVLDRRSGARRFPSGPGLSDPVHKYEFSADGAYLLYVTPADVLHVVELATGNDRVVPTIGHPAQVALAAEDRYLVYLSAGEVPAGPGLGSALPAEATLAGEPVAYGTLFAVDLQAAEQPYELGFCGPNEGAAVRFGCAGFLLSPDGRQVVLTDDRGVWLVQVPKGKPRRLVDQRFEHSYGYSWCGVHIPRAWFPDGQRLLEQTGCEWGGMLAVLDAGTGLEQGLPQTGCYYDCHVEWAWGPAGLWISPLPGALYQVQVITGGFLQIVTTDMDTENRRFWPTQVQALPDGRVLFAHQRCTATSGGGDPWPAPGLFLLQTDGAVQRIWPLPAFPCPDSPYRENLTYPGTLRWTSDGAGFLYLDRDGGALLLGLADGSALWDVRNWLRDASALRWGPGR